MEVSKIMEVWNPLCYYGNKNYLANIVVHLYKNLAVKHQTFLIQISRDIFDQNLENSKQHFCSCRDYFLRLKMTEIWIVRFSS